MAILYLCGAGNPEAVRLALRINQHQTRWEDIILLDDDAAKHGQSILGVTIAGRFAMLEQAEAQSAEVANLVARTTAKRWSARLKIEEYNLPFAPLIHPTVDLMGAEFGRDAIVYQHATIGAQASVGEASVVFMGAVVGHESRLDRCCIVASNAVINARVQVGEGVYVGTNATILPDVTVGPWATIAAGSVVMRDVPAGATVMGIPAKVLMKLNDKPTLRSFLTSTTGGETNGAPRTPRAGNLQRDR